eukprot:m.170190 g.170190  ORF g.170190 m.170190 type:complete len:109 (+) comp14521_c0_seq2:657-983(+)
MSVIALPRTMTFIVQKNGEIDLKSKAIMRNSALLCVSHLSHLFFCFVLLLFSVVLTFDDIDTSTETVSLWIVQFCGDTYHFVAFSFLVERTLERPAERHLLAFGRGVV